MFIKRDTTDRSLAVQGYQRHCRQYEYYKSCVLLYVGVGMGSTWFTLASLYSHIHIFNLNNKQVTLIICKSIAFQSKEKCTNNTKKQEAQTS